MTRALPTRYELEQHIDSLRVAKRLAQQVGDTEDAEAIGLEIDDLLDQLCTIRAQR